MNKNRYIFKIKDLDTTNPNGKKLIEFLSSYNIHIIDDSMFPKMLLVETQENLYDIIPQNIKKMWNIYLEKSYKIPDTRKFIKPKK